MSWSRMVSLNPSLLVLSIYFFGLSLRLGLLIKDDVYQDFFLNLWWWVKNNQFNGLNKVIFGYLCVGSSWETTMERDAIFGTISPSVSSFISNNICLTQNQQKIIFNKTKPDFMNLAWSTQSVRYQIWKSAIVAWPLVVAVFLQTNNGNIKTRDTIALSDCPGLLGQLLWSVWWWGWQCSGQITG